MYIINNQLNKTCIFIPSGSKHRIQASNSGCTVLEISYGTFDEDDIVRIEDDYNRI